MGLSVYSGYCHEIDSMGKRTEKDFRIAAADGGDSATARGGTSTVGGDREFLIQTERIGIN